MCSKNGLRILSESLQMGENTSSGRNSFELNYPTNLGVRQGRRLSGHLIDSIFNFLSSRQSKS
jgi:hypothetical protein